MGEKWVFPDPAMGSPIITQHNPPPSQFPTFAARRGAVDEVLAVGAFTDHPAAHAVRLVDAQFLSKPGKKAKPAKRTKTGVFLET